ncbi:MAG: hypothetical protein GXY83_42100, partial [Rhodopirellula sp.]|nr:hypothetical protein [Rhodopirellula sp.]
MPSRRFEAARPRIVKWSQRTRGCCKSRQSATRTLRLEHLESRRFLTLFGSLDPKVEDSFDTYQSTVQDLYGASAAATLRTTWSDAYDSAIAAGPMSNQLSGPGATLSAFHQDYMSQWQASNSLLSPQLLPSALELALENLGDLETAATEETLTSPTVRFTAGMAGVCWAVDLGAAVFAPPATIALTPWCAGLSTTALVTFGKEYSVNFFVGATDQAIDNLDWSPSSKDRAHDFVDLAKAGYDLQGLSQSLLDVQSFADAPDLLEPLYRNANATAEFVGWLQGLRDLQEDLFRSSDPATAGLATATIASSAIQFQARRIGEQVLQIANQRSLTSQEQDAVKAMFTDPDFSTGFLGFTVQEANQLLQAVGPLNNYVRVQDGHVTIIGGDGPDQIDVYSAVDITGALEITVNAGQTVIVPRSAAPHGVAVYARGGNDQVSIRSDVASVVSGGPGDDTLTGGWGPDILRGGPGNDVLLGRDGDDVLRGDWGDDEVRGGSGHNVLSGGTGNNILIDNHTLVPFEQVVQVQGFGPAPSSSMPSLANVSASPNPVASNAQVTLSTVGANGNGGALGRFEVWEFGQGGRLLGIDDTASDGLSVTIDAAEFGGTGTFKTISHVFGTNQVASNWVARDVIVAADSVQTPVITDIVRTPNPVLQGQTLTLQAHVDDPDNTVDSVQFIWDRDSSDDFNTGDMILGNATPSGGAWTYTLPVTEVYGVGVQRFFARARYDNNTNWTEVVSRVVEVAPPLNSEPHMVALVPSNTILVRGLTLKLTGEGVGGPRPITELRYYWDSNGTGTLESNGGPSDDEFLGSDTDGSNGWWRNFGTSPFPLGFVTFFAQPEDGIQKGNYASATVRFTLPDTQVPTASLMPTIPVTAAGGTAYGFQVTYEDDVAIDVDELGDGDVRVIGPGDFFSQAATFVSVDPPSNGSPRTATYMITPPGGEWDLADNGTYRTYIWNFQVSDTTAHFIPYGELGTFSVTIADTTAPTVSSLSAVDDATDVPLTADLAITFSESVAKGTGNVVIRNLSDSSVFEMIDVASGAVTVTGATATINPSATFTENARYYVEITAGAFEDLAGNDFAGISGVVAWNFTTQGIAPTVVSLSPADDATGVSLTADLAITFSENIQKGTGDIVLKKSSDDSTVETISVGDAAVTISGAVATIDPAITLASSTTYYVEVAAGAFEDLSGNEFAGISGATDWNFTTSDTAPPTATLTSAPSVTVAGGTTYSFTVTYADDMAVRVSTIDSHDLLIWGPGGYGQRPELISVDISEDGTPRVATYHITPPGGTWDSGDNGTYRLETWTNSVTDTTGNEILPATEVGSFQVVISVDTTPPTVATLSPPDNDTGVAVDTNLVIMFSENIQKGTGNILVKKSSDNSIVETISVADAAVTISGATTTIDPAISLAGSTGYYVEVSPGVFEDLAGNAFAGITGGTAWDFTTVDEPRSNLRPGKFGEWPDILTISREPGTPIDDDPLYSNEELFVDVGVWNGSALSTESAFEMELYVDGALSNTWRNVGPLSPWIILVYFDHPLGALPAGDHELMFIVDSTGAVAESNESDNTYVRTIHVAQEVDPPSLSSLYPADDATGVALDPNLVITFDETIAKGAGNIVLMRSSDSATVETIAVSSAQVTVSGTVATIDPSVILTNLTDYYVEVAGGAFEDLAGNAFVGIAGETAWNFTTGDVAGPSILDVADISPDPRNTPVHFADVEMSEAVNLGTFTYDDITLTRNGASVTLNSAVTVALQTGTTYRVSGLSEFTGSEGTYVLTVNANSIEDSAGNSGTGSAWDEWVVDATLPSVTINQAASQSDPTNASPINFTVVFSEPVSDFATGDVTLNGTAGATTAVVTGSGTTYNLAVSGMTASGTVIARIDAGKAHDAAGNANTASTSSDHTVTYDATPPSVTINQAASQSDPTNASPINFTVVFSEPVSDFATGDVTLSGTAGATAAIVSGSGTTYNVAVSGMTQSGTVIARIDAGKTHDAAGNANTASSSNDHTVTFVTTYTVETFTDPNTGNLEYKLSYEGFHFATVLQTPAGAISFRGHPDQNEPNGWGSTVQENVFIAGPGVDATGGEVTSAIVDAGGIQVSAGGDVPSAGGSTGTWTWISTITYDPSQDTVMAAGTTTVTLAAELAGHMNVGRIGSNYLYNYPLNGGGRGPTGDMKSMTFGYGPDARVGEIQWTPLPGLEGTSPQDASDELAITVWGQINRSDPLQTTVAKPTVERRIVSSDATTKLIVAASWDSSQVGYQFDNVGVEPVVLPQNTQATHFVFQTTESWALPDSSNPTITADSLTTASDTPTLTGTVNPSSPGKPLSQVMVVVVGSQTRLTLPAMIDGTDWSVAISTPLAAGTYDVQATATDTAGNTAFETATLTVNGAPVVSLANATSTLAEDTDTTNRLKVADVVVSDDALGTNGLTLSGADKDLFEVEAASGTGAFIASLYLKAGIVLDYEMNAVLDVTVEVGDATVGVTPDASVGFTLNVTDVNEAPVLTPIGNRTVDEQATLAFQATATDQDNPPQTLTYTLDQAAIDLGMSIDPGTGQFTWTPTEAQGSADYTVTITVTDDGTNPDNLSDSETITITVAEVNDAPTAVIATPNPASLAENTDTTNSVKVADITVTDDGLGTNDLSVIGVDAASFVIVGTELHVKAGVVLGLETQAAYHVTVHLDDPSVGATPDASVAFTLNLTDVNEAPTLDLRNKTASLAENTSTSARIKVADILVSDDALGSETLLLSGVDAAMFEIEGSVLYLKAGAAIDFETNPQLDVTAAVDDTTLGGSVDDFELLSIAITDVNEAPTDLLLSASSVAEDTDTTAGYTVGVLTGTDPDTVAPWNNLSYTVTGGAD